jgi:hypothetical protein
MLRVAGAAVIAVAGDGSGSNGDGGIERAAVMSAGRFVVMASRPISRRAWDLRLLAPSAKSRKSGNHHISDQDVFERSLENGHDVEAKSGQIGDTTVKSGYRSTPGKTFTLRGTNSVERGVHRAAHVTSHDANDEAGDSLYDNYSEDGGA